MWGLSSCRELGRPHRCVLAVRESISNNDCSEVSLFAAAAPHELSATLAILYTSYCRRLKTDPVWRRQLLVLFLCALYWPMYTRNKHWKPPLTSNFFKVVLAKSVALSELDDANQKIARFVKRAKECGFQGIIEEDVS
mgnify:CR=1 FL=1